MSGGHARKRRRSSDDHQEDLDEQSEPDLSQRIKDCYVKIKNEKFFQLHDEMMSKEEVVEDNLDRNTSVAAVKRNNIKSPSTKINESNPSRKPRKYENSKNEIIIQPPNPREDVNDPPETVDHSEVPVEIVEDVPALVKQETGDEWYFGSVYSCFVCDLVTKIRRKFENHVETQHNSSLKFFHRKYQVSPEKYECKICGVRVKHEKDDISKHVDSHFLSLEQYEKLYETNMRDIIRKKLEEEREAASAKCSKPMTDTDKNIPCNTSTKSDPVKDFHNNDFLSVLEKCSEPQPTKDPDKTSKLVKSAEVPDKITESKRKSSVGNGNLDLDDYDSNLSSMIEETLKDLDVHLDDPESSLSKLVTEVVTTEDLDMIEDSNLAAEQSDQQSEKHYDETLHQSEEPAQSSRESETSSVNDSETTPDPPHESSLNHGNNNSNEEDDSQEKEDVHIYCCPINNCNFVTSFEVRFCINISETDCPMFRISSQVEQPSMC